MAGDNVKAQVAERSRELGLYDFMVGLARRFGAFEAVRIETYHDNRWQFDLGYGVEVITERVIESLPVTWVETRTECLLIGTQSGQRYVLKDQVVGGYVRYQNVWPMTQ